MMRVTVRAVLDWDEGTHVVVLQESGGRRVTGVWMGRPAADAIGLGITQSPTPRPMTYRFMADILREASVEVEEVRVEALEGDTFVATAKLRDGVSTWEVDARPSDALPLAVSMGSPIYVADHIMERAGYELPEGVDERALR